MNPTCELAVLSIIILSALTNIPYTAAFHHGSNVPLLRRSLRPQQYQRPWIPTSSRNRHHLHNWIGDLWSEIIEFSTYGPEERKMLADRRKAAAAAAAAKEEESGILNRDGGEESDEENLSVSAFSKAKKELDAETETNSKNSAIETEELDLSPEAFQAAMEAKSSPAAMDDFDGYALRDLLVSKWGAQLDIDFQRNTLLSCVYCNVLPVSFGNKRCRHESELAYLMHLQGIIEILRKYDNLELFVDFIETTNKVPRPGTDAVPFRLVLTEEQLQKIL